MHDILPTLPALFDSMDDLVLVKGPRSKLMWANQAFCTYYGMSNEQLESLVDAEHSDPDDTVQYVRDDRHVYTTGQALIVDEPVTRADGVVEYFRTAKSALRDRKGEIIGTIGISHPIATAPVVEETRFNRKERLQYLRTLTAALPVPLALFDMQGRVIASSNRFHSFASWMGPRMGFVENVLSENQVLIDAVEHVLNTATGQAEREVQLDSGAWVYLHAIPWTLEHAQGGAMLLLQDTTELRANERRLADLITELESSNAALSEFAFIASHDLSEPARMVNSYAQLLSMDYGDLLDADGKQYLGFIEEGATRMTALVRDVLELSRRGSETLEMHSVSLLALLDSVLHDLREQVDPAAVTLPEDIELLVDAGQMRILLGNLIGNAVKFRHPDRAPHVVITMERLPRRVRIAVSDNGIGIDPQFHDRVFRLFSRLHAREAFPGTGIGLTICRRVAERHGGTLTLQSALGSGSTFTMELPMDHSQ